VRSAFVCSSLRAVQRTKRLAREVSGAKASRSDRPGAPLSKKLRRTVTTDCGCRLVWSATREATAHQALIFSMGKARSGRPSGRADAARGALARRCERREDAADPVAAGAAAAADLEAEGDGRSPPRASPAADAEAAGAPALDSGDEVRSQPPHARELRRAGLDRGRAGVPAWRGLRRSPPALLTQTRARCALRRGLRRRLRRASSLWTSTSAWHGAASRALAVRRSGRSLCCAADDGGHIQPPPGQGGAVPRAHIPLQWQRTSMASFAWTRVASSTSRFQDNNGSLWPRLKDGGGMPELQSVAEDMIADALPHPSLLQRSLQRVRRLRPRAGRTYPMRSSSSVTPSISATVWTK
jgi:hypothetical protein